jgi:hypothetical protein
MTADKMVELKYADSVSHETVRMDESPKQLMPPFLAALGISPKPIS